MKLNKFLSFDISLHKTLYFINKNYPYKFLSYKSLMKILDDNWLSTGYQSKHEESLFKSFAATALMKYSINPLDKGCDIVLLDKFITDIEDSKIKCTKIDKLHFLSNEQLELIDYKSGKYIPPISKSLYSQRHLFSINSVKKKLGVYPDIFSLYYLRHGIKITFIIDIENPLKSIDTNDSYPVLHFSQTFHILSNTSKKTL